MWSAWLWAVEEPTGAPRLLLSAAHTQRDKF